MKIAIMQPYLFPYIGYWQLINAVDKYVIYDDVNYIKNGWINRNYILLNGTKHLITLPLNGASSFLKINQIQITSNKTFIKKILKTIETAYKKAPFYEIVFPIVENIIKNEGASLSETLTKQLILISNYLGIKTEFILSSSIRKNDDLKSEEKILHICELLSASTYINAIGGVDLYNKNNFKEHDIELKFLKTGSVTYQQFKNEFIPNLSILDMMMFCSPKDINRYLLEYRLL